MASSRPPHSPERKTLILTSTASAMEFEHHRSSSSSSSPKQRPRHSISLSRCFSTYGGGGGESPLPSPLPSPSPSPSLLRTSSTWLRLGRLGRRRRFSSGDFRYDPLSYALNFDEGGIGIHGDDDDDDGAGAVPVGSGVGPRYFSSGLPALPRPEVAVGVL